MAGVPGMDIKKRLIGAEVVNGKDNGKGEIEYLFLQKGDRLIILKPKHINDVFICEEMR